MQIRFGFSGVSPTLSDPLYFLCQYNFALHSKSDSKSHSSDHLIFPIFSHLILLIIGFTDVNPLSRRNFVQTLYYGSGLFRKGCVERVRPCDMAHVHADGARLLVNVCRRARNRICKGRVIRKLFKRNPMQLTKCLNLFLALAILSLTLFYGTLIHCF